MAKTLDDARRQFASPPKLAPTRDAVAEAERYADLTIAGGSAHPVDLDGGECWLVRCPSGLRVLVEPPSGLDEPVSFGATRVGRELSDGELNVLGRRCSILKLGKSYPGQTKKQFDWTLLQWADYESIATIMRRNEREGNQDQT